MEREQLEKEVKELIEKDLGIYNGKLMHLSYEDKSVVAEIITKSFLLGLDYAVSKANQLIDKKLK